MNIKIHSTAEVDKSAKLGEGVSIWNNSQIRENVEIGDETIIGKNVYIDHNIRIGKRCKIQNNVSIYFKTIIEDGVFIGPNVVFTNDRIPRAIFKDGSVRGMDDVIVTETKVGYGASIGAGAIIIPGIKIGKFAMIGAGSVVTKDVPDFTLVLGNPAREVAQIDEAGNKINLLK